MTFPRGPEVHARCHSARAQRAGITRERGAGKRAEPSRFWTASGHSAEQDHLVAAPLVDVGHAAVFFGIGPDPDEGLRAAGLGALDVVESRRPGARVEVLDAAEVRVHELV